MIGVLLPYLNKYTVGVAVAILSFFSGCSMQSRFDKAERQLLQIEVATLKNANKEYEASFKKANELALEAVAKSEAMQLAAVAASKKADAAEETYSKDREALIAKLRNASKAPECDSVMRMKVCNDLLF
jgi:hypothetical protein